MYQLFDSRWRLRKSRNAPIHKSNAAQLLRAAFCGEESTDKQYLHFCIDFVFAF